MNKPFLPKALGAILLTTTALDAPAANEALRNWPQWRGPLANGIAPEADPPLEWSETKNVKWKAKLPGEGSATPAVWGDRIFVLAAVGSEKKADSKPSETKPAEAEARPAAPPPGTGPGGGPPGPGGERRRPGGPARRCQHRYAAVVHARADSHFTAHGSRGRQVGRDHGPP